MIGALRSVLIERGLDPRDFTLCAFGGAGPLHASRADREMGIPRAIVPEPPGPVLGLRLHPDRRPGRSPAHHPADHQALRSAETANRVMDELVSRVPGGARAAGLHGGHRRSPGARDALSRPELRARAAGRLRALRPKRPSTQLWQAFHAAHEARFGFAIPGEIIEIVNYTVTAVSLTPKPEPRADRGRPAAQRRAEAAGARSASSTAAHECRSSGARTSCAGQRIEGPALIEEAASVTVLESRPAPVGRRLGPPADRVR